MRLSSGAGTAAGAVGRREGRSGRFGDGSGVGGEAWGGAPVETAPGAGNPRGGPRGGAGYSDATPVIVEWRKAKAEYKDAAAKGIVPTETITEERLLVLGTAIIEEHELMLPPCDLSLRLVEPVGPGRAADAGPGMAAGEAGPGVANPVALRRGRSRLLPNIPLDIQDSCCVVGPDAAVD